MLKESSSLAETLNMIGARARNTELSRRSLIFSSARAKPMIQRDKNEYPQLAVLAKAFDNHQDKEAIRLARELLNDSDEQVRIEAKRILASCLFAIKAYEEASSLWVSLFEVSEAPEDWVSTVTSLIYAKKIDEADRFFPIVLQKLNALVEQADLEGGACSPGVPTGARLFYFYACACVDSDVPERGLTKISDLAKFYTALGTTDSHMLLIRGMVDFPLFCKLLKEAYPGTQKNPIWTEIFNELVTGLDDDGKSAIQELRDSLGNYNTA